LSNRTKGILSILASAFGFALMAALIRLCDDYGAPISTFQKSFFRNLVAVALAAAVYFRPQGAGLGRAKTPASPHPPDRSSRSARSALPTLASNGLSGRVGALIVLRSVLGTAGIFANFYALSHIPIAEGQTLNKTAPFFTVLFSWLFLSERANLKQALALAVAFCGVILVAKPGFAGAAAFPLAMGLFGGMCAGGAYACVHQLGLLKVSGALIILFFSGFSTLASVPFVWCHYVPMTAAQVLILCGVGSGAAIGQFGITAAYRFAEPRQIAVFDYTSILFAALFGFLLFGQVPDALSALGFVLIVLAALRMRA